LEKERRALRIMKEEARQLKSVMKQKSSREEQKAVPNHIFSQYHIK
jgi:hypothetical protein